VPSVLNMTDDFSRTDHSEDNPAADHQG
jgi:hypothetical protein